MNARLFAAVCPTFGHKFAFEAVNENVARDWMRSWNRYHSFQGTAREHTIEEITADQLPGLRISVHNEYIEFLA